MNSRPTGVLLLNMGGPDKLEDVPEFLYNLFSDRDIIRLGPWFMQKLLARIISSRRAPKSKAIYQKIGGSSPLLKITSEQAGALEQLLADDGHYLVGVAMRYWRPTAHEALAKLAAQGVKEIIALPLYPHYTRATSGSSLKDLREQVKLLPDITLTEIHSWPSEPKYVKALVQLVLEGKKLFGDEPFQLVYSAHSLPVSFINDGDPYVDELGQTISAIEKQTNISGLLCYQSRSGPVEWLSPSTSETIEQLAQKGCKNILMLPISFVSDHVETLYEVNMQFKEEAAALGIRLESTGTLNLNPLFIEALRELVLRTRSQRPGQG